MDKSIYLTSNIPFLRNDKPLCIAHRGRSAYTPENSFQSFKEAYELGVDVLDADIRLTKDNIPVVFHDKTLDRTTNGKGPVLNYTFEQLQEFDSGYWFEDPKTQDFPFREKGFQIISLIDLFEKFPKVKINLELKDKMSYAPSTLLDTIITAGSEDRVIVGSFRHKQLSRFRDLSVSRQIPTSASPVEVLSFLMHLQIFTKRTFCALQVPPNVSILKIATYRNIRRAHKRDLAVHIWTINERETMRRMLSWGIDGIFTDDPEMLLEELNHREEKKSKS